MSFSLPAGDYELVSYVRPCDGSCEKNAETKRAQKQQSAEIQRRVLANKLVQIQTGPELKRGIGVEHVKKNKLAKATPPTGAETVMVKTATLVTTRAFLAEKKLFEIWE